MKTLIRSALIIDPISPHHGKKRDILLDEGKIISIAASIDNVKAKEIAGKGICVSPGWIDLRANFCDPGFEFKESIRSGAEAARRGGFRTVVLMPGTLPTTDSKGAVEYLISKSQAAGLKILPTGSLSEKMEGKQLSEMYDMHLAGAVAFTDDKNHVGTELMSRALEYSRNFGGLVMSFPFDSSICQHGQVNEGPVSVATGMKGIPNISEEIRLQRDIELVRYNGGRLHVSLVSTSRSVDLIRKAKKEGLQVTCAIAAHQLSFMEDDLHGFDTNLKVLPPFRNREDRKAIIAGLKDGTIDAICSDHSPEDIEHKVREFEDANFGISSIQTAFCSAYTALEKYLTAEELIQKFTSGPASILGIGLPKVKEGEVADLTLFSLDENTRFEESTWASASKNSPFIGKELRGRIINY